MSLLRNKHEQFKIKTIEDLHRLSTELNIDLPVTEDIGVLFEPVQCGNFRLPNRMVILPMEGCDGKADGSPDELTFRRYRRFAAGGAGLLWFEATAVVPEGRANPRQLWLHPGSLDGFKKLVELTLKTAREEFGEHHRPLLIIQLTHSGRYSKPGRKPSPIIAHHSPYLDPTHNLPPDYPLISDSELERLEDYYVQAAILAREAGFDGVDIKACHRYLISELHASFTRPNSKYGGEEFENRTRFFRNIVNKIRSQMPNYLVTSRMNAYDAMAYPYGFGVCKDDPSKPDLTEPIKLVEFLKNNGAPVVNITVGNPYYNPHINRPFDKPTSGAPLPNEHPLVGVDRFIQVVRQIQSAFPDMLVIGGGYSWLRHLFPNVAAGAVRRGWVSLIGIGRMAFAYPDCIKDLQTIGYMRRDKSCIACSACTQIMRDGGKTGCVPRDSAIYAPIYREGRAEAVDTIIQMAKTCRQCDAPTCVGKCPATVDIPAFIGYIAEKKFRDAYEVLRLANILTTTCGYACPAEVQCESGCVNQHFGEPVPIRHLQRWVSKLAIEEGWAAEPRRIPVLTGKKVAVVGAGPAGISAAAHLAEAGHSVILYDKEHSPGGLARTVIPEYRLPDEIIKREIDSIIASYSGLIELRKGVFGKDFNLIMLLEMGYDAILLAMGLPESTLLNKDSMPASGVIGALEFLRNVKAGYTVKGVVIVLGGGNTAFDAAIMAKRVGATDVYIVYRRSFKEMPAWQESIKSALNAGVHILTHTTPISYIVDSENNLKGIKLARTVLGEPDEKGRRTPLILRDTEHIVPADLVIEALGQRLSQEIITALGDVKLTSSGLIWVNPETMETSVPKVFAAGDVVNGGSTVVRAVAEGLRAARSINALFSSKPVSVPIH